MSEISIPKGIYQAHSSGSGWGASGGRYSLLEAGLLQLGKAHKATEGEKHQQICNFGNLGRHVIRVFFMGKQGGGISINKFCVGFAREREVPSAGCG